MISSSPARRHRNPRFSIKPVCFAACLAAQSLAMALPQGATPTFGQTQVKQTSPGQLAITQTTGKAGIDWQSFSIGAGERVIIQQPNASSVLLNRVTGYDPSLILGQMQSNGRIFLTNPRGVIFGAGSQVDVGGLVATSLGITNEAVQSGRYQLLAGSTAPGSIVAGGSIRASGTVALVAPVVEQTGSIVAGRVGLAAASSVLVDVDGDGLIFFNARNDGLDARLSVLGNIQAQGGTADIRAVARSGFADTVLNLDGVVQARGLTAQGGRIVIDGGTNGITAVNGRVDASSGAPGLRGGDVQVTGDKVYVGPQAVLEASGPAGGGNVLVGGNWQGQGPLPNASMTYVSPGAVLDASAKAQGDGGTVVVWSDTLTRFYGSAHADGGSVSGDGGRVEVSGKKSLDFNGDFSAKGVNGRDGLLLLDPENIDIAATGTARVTDPIPVTRVFVVNDNTGTVNPVLGWDTIATALGGGLVIVQTAPGGNITVTAATPALQQAAGPGNLLTLNSAGNITLNAGADIIRTALGGGVSLIATGGIALNAGITTNNGPVSVASGTAGITQAAASTLNSGNGTISLNGGVTGAITLAGALTTNNTTANAIAITNASDVQLGNVSTGAAGVTAVSFTGAGNQVLGGVIGGTGSLSKADVGTLTLSSANTYSGGTTITGGAVRVSGATATAGTGAIAIGAAGTLDITGGANVANAAVGSAGGTISSSTGNGTLSSAAITLTGTTTFGSGDATTGLVVSGVVGGAAGIGVTKAGAGLVTFQGANTYAGDTAIDLGTLRADGATAKLGANAANVTLAAGATLDITGGANVTNASVASAGGTISSSTGAGTLTATMAMTGTTTLSATDTTTGLNVVGLISGGAGNGITKAGAGLVTLSQVAPNTYTGTTTVTAGTLRLGANEVLLDTGDLTVNGATAVFDLAGRTETVGAVSLLNGSIVNSGGAATLTGTGYAVESGSISAVLAGAGVALNKSNTGTVTLSAANTYTGTNTVSNGTLRIDGAAATAGTGTIALTTNTAVLDVINGASVANAITSAGGTIGNSTGLGTLAAANGLTLTADSVLSSTLTGAGNGLTVAKNISGGFGVTKTGAGTVTLTGTNTYNGATGTVVSDGTLSLGAANALPNAALTVNGTGASMDLNGQNVTTGAVTLVAGSIVNSGAAATLTGTSYGVQSGTISAALGGATSDLTKATGGTVVLSGASTYRNTIVNAGTLQLGANNVLPDAGALTVSGTGTVFDLNGRTDTVGAVTLVSGSINDVAGGGSLTGTSYAVQSGSIGAVLAGATSDLTKSTGGTVTLTSASTYRNTSIDGTLQVSGAAATAGTGTIALTTNTAVLDVINGASVANAITSAGGTIGNSTGLGTLAAANGLTLTADSVLSSTLTGAGNGLTVAKNISGGFGVTKTGAGTVTLTGTNTYNGATGTVVSDGTLSLGAANALPNAALTVNGTGASMDLNGQNVTTGAVTLVAGSIVNSGAAATLTGTSYGVQSGTISAALGGATSDLTKATGGTVVLSGASTYRNTIVNAGTLQLGANNVLPDAGALTVSGTGTVFDLNGRTDTVGAVTLVSGSINDVAGGGSLTGTSYAVQSGSIGAVLAGATSDLTKSTGGTVNLSGANTYRDTLVSDGTLRLGANNVLSNAGTLTVNGANAVFDLNGHTDIVGGATLITGALNDLAGGGSLNSTTGYAVQSGDVGAVLTGSGTLTKTTTGLVTLTAANTYGATAANAGTLRVSGATAKAGTGAITLASGATLDIIGSANVDSASLTSNGGTVSTSNGTGTLSSAAVTLAATTAFNAAGTGDTLTVSGVVGGAAGANLSKTGLGTLSLSGTNTYAGSTDITAGTLQASGATAKLGTGVIDLGASGTLDIIGSATVSNANLTSTGGGTIAASSGAGTLQSAVALGAGTTTTLSAANTTTGLTLSGPITGATGAITKQGAGLATLSSATNSYGGVTTVANGTLATSAAQRLPDAGAVVVNSPGNLRLGGDETIGSLAGNGSVDLGNHALSTGAAGSTVFSGNLSGTGSTLIKLGAGTTFTLGGTIAPTTIDVEAGTLTFLAGNVLGDTSIVDVKAPGILKLAGNDTVGSLTLAGTLSGTAATDTLTAATYGLNNGATVTANLGTGTLTSNGSVTLNGTSAATAVNVVTGTLALGSANRLDDGATVTVSSHATLRLNGNDTVTQLVLSGTLAGTGVGDTLTATQTSPTAGYRLLNGSVIGAKLGAGTLSSDGTVALNATSGATTVTVATGTLSLGAANLLDNNAAVTVATPATLKLNGSDTVGSLALAGTLNGTASTDTLTAATYALASGTANANLGTGTLTSTGASALNGTSAAATVNVTAGTLTLGSANRLADGATVTVSSPATLKLNGNDTVTQLVLSGTLAGTGLGDTLTATQTSPTAGYRLLNGSVVGARLGAGTLSSDGTVALNATSGATSVTIATGTLTLAAANLLDNAAAVTIATPATLKLNGNDTVGSLALSGTLNGTAAADTLTATTYALASGTANANLGTGALTSTGTSALNGTSAATTVDVNSGTLALGSANRLADTATVTVATPATLTLNGNDTIANLALSGTLAGTAPADTLNAATQATLSGGNVNTALTTPLLTSSGSSVIAADVVASTSATVNSGTLTIGATGTLSSPSIFVLGGTLATSADNRIGDTSALVVATGATLALGGNDSVTSLALSGSLVASGGNRLTASTSASLSGGNVLGNLTTPMLTSSGTSLIAADVRATSKATIVSGTTTISATGSLTAPTVRVDGGATLATATDERIGNTSSLDIASGATLQLGGIETVSAVSLAGRVTGPGSLNSSGGTTIADGSLDSPLTTTTLTSLGTSSIGAAITATTSATVQSGSLTINAGSLTSPLIAVQAGSLITTASGQIGSSSSVSVATGASLQLAGAENIGAFTLLGSLDGTGNLLANGVSLDGGTVNISLSANTLTSTGASTLHAATSVASTATVTGGTLTIAADGSLAAPTVSVQGGTLATASDERIADSAALQIGNGGTLSLGGSETVASLADVTGQTADGTAAVQLGTHVLTVRNLAATTDTSFGGVISGNGADALVKEGLGTLRLAGPNTYTGSTLINAGTLATIGNERLADASTVQIANGATFALGGSETVASIADKAGQAADGSARIQLGTHLLTVANADAATDTTFSGVISGTGADALTKAGAGTLRLAGANTYTGTTLVAAGTLATLGSERLADASALQVANGATLQLGGSETIASIADQAGQTADGTASIVLGANALTVKSLAAATDTRFGGVVSGTGTLIKDGAGTLRLAGANSYSGITLVEAGTLATIGDERLADASNVQVANGARLAIGGTETVASIADKTGQTPNASAVIDVTTALTAGGAADTTYSGTITGAGALAKSGTGTLTLTGNNSYAGTTTIAAGSLQIGSGGTTGSLGQGAVTDNATLRFVRSNDATVLNAISGSGALEQAGSGTLTLSSPLNSYTGTTTITSGTLATAGSNQLPDASAVIVKPGAALKFGGDETVASIQSDGTVTLNGSVTTSGNQTYTGAVLVATAQPITLTALNLDAQAAGNVWGTQPLSLNIGNELKLSAGSTSATAFNDLTLGTVSVGGGASTLEAGLLALSGNFALLGGSFTLTAHAAPASYALVVEEGKVPGSILGPDGRTPVAEASDVITQTGGAITTAAGSSLAFLAPNKGSMTFANEANNFQGALSAVSGTAGAAWTALPQTVTGAPANVPGGAVNGLSRITVAGDAIHVGPVANVQGSGLEADLVRISANTLNTADNGGTIVARLPYNDGLGGGTNASTPGLRITLLPGAFTSTLPFGSPTIGIATRIGDLTDGPIPGIFSAGFMQVLPLAGRQGDTSVFLTGPTVSLAATGYRFFNDGAGVLTEIPVYYNGFSPDTPQKSGALSAAASVSEEARRQRFEEAVRTENVAVRLRSGVIAEVGPGRPATVGSDGVKPPATCSPKEGELRCADAPAKTNVSSVMGALRKVVGR